MNRRLWYVACWLTVAWCVQCTCTCHSSLAYFHLLTNVHTVDTTAEFFHWVFLNSRNVSFIGEQKLVGLYIVWFPLSTSNYTLVFSFPFYSANSLLFLRIHALILYKSVTGLSLDKREALTVRTHHGNRGQTLTVQFAQRGSEEDENVTYWNWSDTVRSVSTVGTFSPGFNPVLIPDWTDRKGLGEIVSRQSVSDDALRSTVGRFVRRPVNSRCFSNTRIEFSVTART